MSEEIVKKQNEEMGNVAHRHYLELIEALKNARANFLISGCKLYLIQIDNEYTALGYSSMNEFLASPEVCLNSGTAKNLIGIYRRYCVELHYDPSKLVGAPTSKLTAMITCNKKQIEELLPEMNQLSRDDFRRRVKEVKGEPVKEWIDEKIEKDKIEDMQPEEVKKELFKTKNKLEKTVEDKEQIKDNNKSKDEKIKELEKENGKLKKKLEEKEEVIKNLRDEIKGNQPTLNTRPYTEYWNEKNKEYFGHMMFECKGKEGKIISRWPTPEIMALRNIVGRLGEKTKAFIDYIYADEFWRDKTQPSRVGSTKTMDMILKQRKGKKKKREKFDMDYSNEERPSKEESEAFINKLKKNRTKK